MHWDVERDQHFKLVLTHCDLCELVLMDASEEEQKMWQQSRSKPSWPRERAWLDLGFRWGCTPWVVSKNEDT